MLDKADKALDDIKSVHLSSETISGYSVMGTDVDINMDMEIDIDIENGLMYGDMTADYNGINNNSSIYMKTTGNKSDLYMGQSGMWMKQTGIEKDDIYKLGYSFEGVEGMQFYLRSMEDLNLDSDSDKENYIVSGIIGSKSSEEALEKAGFLTVINQLDSGNFMSDSEKKDLISNVSPIKATFYIDKKTFLPSKIIMDMKETTESIYSNMNDIVAKYGTSLDYSITKNEGITTFSQYDSVSEITIPDEAMNGIEYQIIQ